MPLKKRPGVKDKERLEIDKAWERATRCIEPSRPAISKIWFEIGRHAAIRAERKDKGR